MSLFRSFARVVMRDPRVTYSAGFLVLITLAAIFAPWIVPQDPNLQSLAMRLRPPAWIDGGTWTHPLGTDQLGRDLLSRVIMGARVSLLVGLTTVVVGASIGATVGLLAGYFGGNFERVVMRLADIQLSFPYILLTLAVIAVFGPGLLNVILVLGVASWPAYARIARGSALSVKQRDYVASAIALGGSSARVIGRHVAPNIANALVILATLQISQMMMAEAALSFLGAGVPITTPTWGGMLNEGQRYIFGAWWLTVMPGVALTTVVIAFNFLGDGLSDLLG
ncbi:MAG: ABC transporter permease [Gemmatimonadaceae bacterium]|nr:ABC transporter permease [Gemmatimonadaceae bacterium]